MSIVNAVTIFAENLQTANIVVGNSSSNLTITANSISVSVGSNVVVNSTAIRVGNSTINTVVNSTSIAAANITLNGVTYSSIASQSTPGVDYQVFTNPAAANFWYKPSWATANDVVTIQMWGGGGGGTTIVGVSTSGGGGGACVIVNKLAGECNAVCNVVVGSGGTSRIQANADNGGTSVFWSNSSFSILSYGGAGAFANSTVTIGGGGGGWFSTVNTTTTANGGTPLGGIINSAASSRDSTFGGGSGSNNTLRQGGSSVYGGGGGSFQDVIGGTSIYGGGGGANEANGGSSVFGGRGANSTTDATAPGGGGTQLSGGARGEVRIWTTPSRI
jgi:hypothetical protein